MAGVKQFDLMQDKPKLDMPTLNFIWDRIMRKDMSTQPRNEFGRQRKQERAEILHLIQEFALLENVRDL